MSALQPSHTAAVDRDGLTIAADLYPCQEYTSLKKVLSSVSNAATPEAPPLPWPDKIRRHKPIVSDASLHIDIPPLPAGADVALAVMQYLPTPVLVLSSLKTVVLANESMGRLLGLRNIAGETDGAYESMTDVLKGQTLSQIGIDMISDGAPVWVSWEKFLDNLVAEAEEHICDARPRIDHGEATPTTAASPFYLRHPDQLDERECSGRPGHRDRTLIHDTIVDVIVSSSHLHRPDAHHQKHQLENQYSSESNSGQCTCRMVISIWALDDQRFFTLSFTPVGPTQYAHGSHSHVVPRAKSAMWARSPASSYPHTPASSTTSPVLESPPEATPTSSVSVFSTSTMPSKCPPPAAMTDLQKVTRMKDAMLSAMEIPILAMWKDESVVFPNPAARQLLAVSADATSDDSYDFISRFKPWAADFSRPLEDIDNPIISLCRTQKAFTKWHIGLINEQTGKRSRYDVSGHPVFDEKTGDFFAGLIAFKDVTEYIDMLATQTAENEQQFSIVCDIMPQMMWTASPDGYHDYFSQRWYDYTGLNPQNSLGLGWRVPFHPDDLPLAIERWHNSLVTGNTYHTEHRCRRHDGGYRWMLARAMPLRDSKTGKILKWVGSSTDIQDIVDARESAEHTRRQLADVLHVTQMNMWVVDRDGILTFLEGASFSHWDSLHNRKNALGKPLSEIWPPRREGHFVDKIMKAVRTVLDGESSMQLCEFQDGGRYFRSKLVPLNRKGGMDHVDGPAQIQGVVGITTEVTQLRKKEQENIQLLANERAAKEASKMKSSFLANMSHEIRTPIAGVLGMTELLLDSPLNEEQNEFAQNIQRSANSLLTVINDILDFSKIESGKMLIEEVQFSLGVVLSDVTKMLSYAAYRKNLLFGSYVQLGPSDVLLGDPGRVRQILSNLLTNSIKFTSHGHVKLMARVASETSDITTVEFAVEDTGIGIEEDVRRRLFKPFSQADSSTARKFGGTGLGLVISKNLVNLMKGDITIESKLGSGTTARFTIPFKKPDFPSGPMPAPLVEACTYPDRLQSEQSLSAGTSSTVDWKPARKAFPPALYSKGLGSMKARHSSIVAPSVTSEPAEVEISRERVHILVVEDNPINQQIAINFLKSFKFGVSAVWNGKEALEYLLKATNPDIGSIEAKDHPVPAVILMDVQMPVLDGYHATHILRHHEPYTTIDAIGRIPIVAMTASAIRGDREKCERAGMDDYLAKPVQRAVLEKMILKWIHRPREQHQASQSLGADKLHLSPSGTDEGSNCPEQDSAAVLSSGLNPAPRITAPSPSQPLQRDASSSPGQVRRSSLSLSLLASDVTGGGNSDADRAISQVEAEDKARLLRDAKLLSATDEQHGADVGLVSSPRITSPNHSSPGTLVFRPPSYPGLGGSEHGVLALTEENVERFNSRQGSDTNVQTIDHTMNELRIDVVTGPVPSEVAARGNIGGDE
ncbi:hypothetical protein DV737_g1559, partial [Chaetothyriales sp. CBS 132003]